MRGVEKFIPKEISESKEELPPNVKMIETEKAKFRISYGRHFVEMKPEVLGKSDALMLKTGIGLDYTLSKKLVGKKPIFLGDIPER